MPRGRKRVCLLCGKTIEDNNDSVPYKGRYAHSSCFRVAVKAVHVDKTEKLEEKAEQKAQKKRGKPSKPKATVQKLFSSKNPSLFLHYIPYFDKIKQKEKRPARSRFFYYPLFSSRRSSSVPFERVSKRLKAGRRRLL